MVLDSFVYVWDKVKDVGLVRPIINPTPPLDKKWHHVKRCDCKGIDYKGFCVFHEMRTSQNMG